mgnify:CR=1 FL=1
MNQFLIPISLGELVDKLTILEIKSEKFTDSALQNVRKELLQLKNILSDIELDIDKILINELKEINKKLWDIEDAIRVYESKKLFNEKFISLARSVYQFNDQRASLKRKINIKYGSDLIEEKFYSNY